MTLADLIYEIDQDIQNIRINLEDMRAILESLFPELAPIRFLEPVAPTPNTVISADNPREKLEAVYARTGSIHSILVEVVNRIHSDLKRVDTTTAIPASVQIDYPNIEKASR